MAEWAEVRAAGIAEANRTLDARSDAAELRELVAEWLDKVCSSGGAPPNGVAASSATVALNDEFERRDFGQVAEAVRLLDQQEGAIPPGRWLLARLLGSAVASLFADGLIAGVRRPIELMRLESFGAWDAFAAELPERIRSDVAAQAGFWRELGNVVEAVKAEPERCALITEREAVRAAVEAYQKAPKVGEAWETKLDSYVLLEEGFLFALARRLDPERYLAHLGQLPHPAFVGQGIDERHSDDLPHLIRAAPAAQNDAGDYRPEGMIVIALLQACAAECRRRAWGGRDTPEPIDPEDAASLEPARADLEAFTDVAVDALFGRDDAVAVGWLWLERLVFEGECRGLWRCDRQQGTGLVLDPLLVLVNRLAARLEPRTDRLDWIRGARDLWRVHRIAAVLAVEASRTSTNSTDRERGLRELLTALEPAYAGATEAMQRSDCVVGRIGSVHVLATAEPDRFIVALWHELRPVRERAWRGGGAEARNDAAILAVLWAICAMETATGDLKRRLWFALRSVLEAAMQTDHPSSPGDVWPAALRRLCCSAPKILTGVPADDLEVLAELMRPRVRADDLFLQMVLTLKGAGVDGTLIENAVARWELGMADLVRRYLAVESLRIERGHHPRPWLDRVRSLISAEPDRSIDEPSGQDPPQLSPGSV